MPLPKENDENLVRLKKQVKNRDHFKCQFPGCEVKKSGNIMAIHPILPPYLYPFKKYDPDNYVTLCKIHKELVDDCPEKYGMTFVKVIMDKKAHAIEGYRKAGHNGLGKLKGPRKKK